MRISRKAILPLLLTAASIELAGLDKDKPKFTPGTAASHEAKQTIAGVTIAAVPYSTEEKAKSAFGKVDPNKYGILPVLILIQNDSKQAIRLENWSVEFVTPSRDRLEATPAADVKYGRTPKRPNMNPSPIPRFPGRNPLAAPEIEERAFTARILPPGESAHGFFYYQTVYRPGGQIYVKGIVEAGSGKELFFFEIPLQ